jgi:hypothetical protein
MARSLIVSLAILTCGVTAGSRAADDDSIATELTKAREEYTATVEKANEHLLAAFDKQIKAAEGSKRKVEDIVKIVERLQVERDLFKGNTSILPQYSLMKDAAVEYRLKLSVAHRRMGKAFENAIEKYQKNKDLESAKAVLKSKQEWVLESTPFTFEGVWKTTHTDGGQRPWTGTRTVKLGKVYDVDRTECTWERKKGQLVVRWPGGVGWEKLDIDFKNPTKLTGKTNAGRNSVWILQK